ncbi:class I SAM-dependent methyltransferase [Anaeromyxobacter oryzae]|uniref:Uncharacterized protein n=1 Tax=Anaeromyxobacter oryzae TaxID=2918170 RepID=A0ABM7WQG9_9BACT|nr:class I SAM-dependent methyltransferase [Anaeromyxobacter oryzae]BDG01709.1 hypothetical protein AMOR_07050 [Anaeromyxobacter oryzae]
MADLLLHSLSTLQEPILEWLAAARARSVVEIGAEAGLFTSGLAAYAERAGGALTCIDPAPTEALRAAVAAHPSAVLIEARSPAALRSVPAADAYVIDGDHNYATVRGELEAIDARTLRAGRPTLVLLHDVGWPCGRRDFYYAPAALPPGAVHPHAFDRGVVPGDAGTVAGGFRGEGAFAVALREGGPRNGVRTAIDDFLAGRDDLAFAAVPSVFGVGVLWPRAAPWAAELEVRLAPWRDHPVLARLEENRVALYVRVLALQDHAAALEAARQGAERRAAAAEAHAAAEARARAAAEAEAAAMRATLAWRLAEGSRAVRNRLAPRGTLLRRTLDAGADVARSVLAGRGR